jgi:protein-tyrosine phosphatase
MAERILRGRLEALNRNDVEISSASVIDMEGTDADPRAIVLLERNGFRAGEHRSRMLTGAMIDEADKLLVMEQQHRDAIINRSHGVGGKVFLLTAFKEGREVENGEAGDIADPYCRSDVHYRLCFDEIAAAIEGLLQCL